MRTLHIMPLSLVLLVLSGLLYGPLLAEDAKPQQPKNEAPPVKQKPSLADDLIKALDPNADADDVDRLGRAIHGMHRAQVKLQSQDTGKETREVQEQVLRDLDQLIELLRQQQQQAKQKSQQKQQQTQKQQSSKSQPELDPQNSQQQQPQKSNDSPQEADKAKQSTDRTQADKARAEEAARREKLIKDAWGHLPPALRAELELSYNEKYLPKYEDQVRRYYESLAEKNRKKSPKPR